MSLKYNIPLDDILRVIPLNKDELNFGASIVIELDKKVDFEYAIVDSGDEDKAQFKTATKMAVVDHKKYDNVYRKQNLLLRTKGEKAVASISIDIFKYTDNNLVHETYPSGSRGTVLLNAEQGQQGSTQAKVWYKDPWIIGAIVVIILIIAMLVMSNKKKNTEGVFYP